MLSGRPRRMKQNFAGPSPGGTTFGELLQADVVLGGDSWSESSDSWSEPSKPGGALGLIVRSMGANGACTCTAPIYGESRHPGRSFCAALVSPCSACFKTNEQPRHQQCWPPLFGDSVLVVSSRTLAPQNMRCGGFGPVGFGAPNQSLWRREARIGRSDS